MAFPRSASLVAVFLLLVPMAAFAEKPASNDVVSALELEPKVATAKLADRGLLLAGGGSYEQLTVARALYLAGERDRARPILERFSRQGTKEKGDLFRVARVYCEAKEWAAARPVFDQLLVLEADHTQALAAAGYCAWIAGDKESARTYFARAEASDPKAQDVYAAAISAVTGQPLEWVK